MMNNDNIFVSKLNNLTKQLQIDTRRLIASKGGNREPQVTIRLEPD